MEICVSLSSYHGQRRASWIDAIAGYDATVQRFHCCRQDRRACGRQHRRDEPSAMGWNERRVVHMPSAGRTKFADCDAHEDKKVIGMQLSRLCVPGLRRAARGAVNCSCTARAWRRTAAHEKGLFEPNADAEHYESGLPDKKELQRERAGSRALPRIVLGECDSPSHTRWGSILRVGSEIFSYEATVSLRESCYR